MLEIKSAADRLKEQSPVGEAKKAVAPARPSLEDFLTAWVVENLSREAQKIAEDEGSPFVFCRARVLAQLPAALREAGYAR